MSVPLLDLGRQYRSIQESIDAALQGVARSQRFIMGPEVGAFEAAMAAFHGVDHAIGCASGSDALILSLRAMNLKPGDEVITTPFTFFATAGAIEHVGAKPVFVDIDQATYNIDPAQVEAAITPRTAAVLVVHLFGQMADLGRLAPLCEQAGLVLIEDGAQSIGARQLIGNEWTMAGTVGRIGTLSFFPTKNLGGWGDGGMLLTRDGDLAARLRRLRVHGGDREYHHSEVGYNSRLDTIQAAVLLAKLPRLREWNQARRELAGNYGRLLAGVAGVKAPIEAPGQESVWHQYTIRARSRDHLKKFLDVRDIGSKVYYPLPLHLQPCFSDLGWGRGAFPQAERAASEVLSLPIYPELTTAEQEEVVEAIVEFYRLNPVEGW